MQEDLFREKADDSGGDRLARVTKEVSKSTLELQEKLNRNRKLEKLLGDLIRFRDQSWPLHIKSACDREAAFLKALRSDNHPAIPVVEELFRDTNTKAGAAMQAIPVDFERLAKEREIPIDFGRSRHPKYFFGEDGFIEVQIIDNKQTARIGTREGKLAEIPADADAVIETICTELNRLFGRRFNGKRFLTDLRAAYLVATKKKKMCDGDPVPIREVYDSLAGRTKAYRGYKKDEFLVDLSKLVTDGPPETKGHRFELQQTKDTSEGMLLLGAVGRGMVNLLLFKKSTSGES